MVTVRIPGALRDLAGGLRDIDADGDTVGAVIRDVVERHPDLGRALLDGGASAPTCHIYLDGTDIRSLDGRSTPVTSGSTIVVLLAMGGG